MKFALQNLRSFLLFCTVRCLPSLLMHVLSHGFTLYHLCAHHYCDGGDSTSTAAASQHSNDTSSSNSTLGDDVTAMTSYSDDGQQFSASTWRNLTVTDRDDVDTTVTSPCPCSFWLGYE